ncbi:MAG TPA: hypothetical protein VMD09_11445 [Solirubrobacteraceae bacterium]|nr:hypothetical protein [Solirubrobacteraceae bacterium]
MHVLAFGELQSELWGVSWLPGGDSVTRLALRAGAASVGFEVELHAGADDEPWRLKGDGVSLEFTPTSKPGQGRDEELTTQGQLCEVSGQVLLEGREIGVRCLGWRGTSGGGPDLGQLDSFRFLAGWPETAFGFSLLALRPRRARGHEADNVAAVVIEDPPVRPVVDPRLSTTYTDAGLPRRAGLELWLEEEEDEGEAGGSAQYPRRAAGEVVAPGLDWNQGEFALHASLLRWHSHGREGPGVYVLGQHQ